MARLLFAGIYCRQRRRGKTIRIFLLISIIGLSNSSCIRILVCCNFLPVSSFLFSALLLIIISYFSSQIKVIQYKLFLVSYLFKHMIKFLMLNPSNILSSKTDFMLITPTRTSQLVNYTFPLPLMINVHAINYISNFLFFHSFINAVGDRIELPILPLSHAKHIDVDTYNSWIRIQLLISNTEFSIETSGSQLELESDSESWITVLEFDSECWGFNLGTLQPDFLRWKLPNQV